jgi:hypothetical protein
MDWMDANQLGRRNITPDQFTLLLGRRYNRAKNKQGGDRKSSEKHFPLDQGRTTDIAAAKAGLGSGKTYEAATFRSGSGSGTTT